MSATVLVPHTLSSYFTPSPHTADETVLVLDTLSLHHGCESPCSTHPVLVPHALFSYCTPLPPTANPLPVLHTLSPYCTPSPRTAHPLPVMKLSSYWTPSPCTMNMNLLVLHILYWYRTPSLYCTPSPHTADETVLISDTPSLYHGCESPHSAHPLQVLNILASYWASHFF